MTLNLVLLISLLCFLSPQNPADTVAVILSPDTPAVVMLRSEAESEFKKLCADATDDRKLKALAAVLNPMPDWPQFVMNGDASACNRSPKPIVPVPIEKQGKL